MASEFCPKSLIEALLMLTDTLLSQKLLLRFSADYILIIILFSSALVVFPYLGAPDLSVVKLLGLITMTMRTWLNNLGTLPIITPLLPCRMLDKSIIFNKEVFGNIFKRKKHVESRFKGVQNYLERVDSVRHTLLEKELQNEYNHILFQEEILWYQKSQEKWIKFGDKNSAFFHAQTIIRRKKNRIHILQLPNGTWTSDDTILQAEAQNYFKNLLANTQPHHNRTFHHGHHPIIDEPRKISLTNPITKTEVFTALNSMKPYKAPGPDGFQCIFFKQLDIQPVRCTGFIKIWLNIINFITIFLFLENTNHIFMIKYFYY